MQKTINYMIRAIIIDDEPAAVNLLKLLLEKKCNDLVEVIGSCYSAMAGKALIETLSPDLVFLDIEMPGMSGMDLLRLFPEPTFQVIFVTAHDGYAVEAFRLSAMDYLLKPVNSNDLVSAVHKIKNTAKEHDLLSARFQQLEDLLKQTNTMSEPRIAIAMTDKIVFVNIADILYCEANRSYTNVYLCNGEKMVASKALCDFELQLVNHNFFRVHHSLLINLDRVKEFQRHDGGYVIMENGKQLEVSQRKRKEFLEAIHGLVV